MQNWTPVITDLDRKNKAESIIEHINTYFNSNDSKHEDLMYGHVGVGIYFGYQYSVTKDEKYLERCISVIEKSIEDSSINSNPNFAFGNGIIGSLWGIGHLISIGLIDANLQDLVDEHPLLFF